MIVPRILAAAAVAAVLPALAAAAGEAPPTASECRERYQACQADCDRKHADDEVKRAACLPVCSARYAACDAAAAFERARPWLEDKAKKTKDFLEDLMETPPAGAPAPDAPAAPAAPDTTRT